jgi:hypothetical protein
MASATDLITTVAINFSPDSRNTSGPGVVQFFVKRLSIREKRLFCYLLIVLAFAAWKFTPRPWKPTRIVETAHYSIASTASAEQTEQIARVVEILYESYSNKFSTLPTFIPNHPRLKLLLYKDRAEMRRINPGLGWAEAFYRKPYCRAYFSADEINPYHWMLHEAVHQLNTEVANIHLEKWLEEGLAEYFSTSRIKDNQLLLGHPDLNTYPVWWLDDIAKDSDLNKNLSNGSVIPLRAIITNHGGPRMNSHFNLYYLHWWTLTHFLFESKQSSVSAMKIIQSSGDLKSVEELCGPVQTLQTDWHAHVRALKRRLP